MGGQLSGINASSSIEKARYLVVEKLNKSTSGTGTGTGTKTFPK
jgi:hypothetical protein